MLSDLGYVVIGLDSEAIHIARDYIFNYIINHGYNLVYGEDRKIYDEAFNKGARVFPRKVAWELAQAVRHNVQIMELLPYNEMDFNRLSSYELERNPNLERDQYHIYWRLVRPGFEDVGQPHKDSQFYGVDQEREVVIENARPWKIWLPIAGCTVNNSIRVIPASHNMDIPVKEIQTVNGPKPDIDEEWLFQHRDSWVCPFTEWDFYNNSALLFNWDLVHVGPSNNEKSLRISAEITIYVN